MCMPYTQGRKKWSDQSDLGQTKHLAICDESLFFSNFGLTKNCPVEVFLKCSEQSQTSSCAPDTISVANYPAHEESGVVWSRSDMKLSINFCCLVICYFYPGISPSRFLGFDFIKLPEEGLGIQ